MFGTAHHFQPVQSVLITGQHELLDPVLLLQRIGIAVFGEQCLRPGEIERPAVQNLHVACPLKFLDPVQMNRDELWQLVRGRAYAYIHLADW